MRYVRNKLVLRLKKPPADELMAQIQRPSPISCRRKLQAERALPEEQEELAGALPRLVMRFNRRNLGRLRMLIDA